MGTKAPKKSGPVQKAPGYRPGPNGPMAFKSWRASAPHPKWKLLEISGRAMRTAREEADISQKIVAEWLSSGEFEVLQEEISRLEHEPEHCWVNEAYAIELGRCLQVDWHTLCVNAPAPTEPEPIVWEDVS